ncbi:MAG: LysR family transcriptional regulator [Bacilli bacterium]
MNISLLRTFVIAAQTQHISQTAELLHLTQPAITKHIQRLEQELGVPLFTRSGKKLVLSTNGELFLPHAQHILTTLQQELAMFHTEKQQFWRSLRIACAPQIATSILPHVITQFTALYPHVELNISIVSSTEIEHSLCTNNTHLGLTKIMPTSQTLITQPLLHEPIVLVAHASAISAENSLFQTKYLLTNNQSDVWDLLLQQIYMHYPSCKMMSVQNVDVTKALIATNFGFSYLPLSVVQKEMIVVPNVKIVPPQTSIYAVYKESTTEIEAFCALVKEFVQWNCG